MNKVLHHLNPLRQLGAALEDLAAVFVVNYKDLLSNRAGFVVPEHATIQVTHCYPMTSESSESLVFRLGLDIDPLLDHHATLWYTEDRAFKLECYAHPDAQSAGQDTPKARVGYMGIGEGFQVTEHDVLQTAACIFTHLFRLTKEEQETVFEQLVAAKIPTELELNLEIDP